MLLLLVVKIMLSDRTSVLHGPFGQRREADQYAADYVSRNPRVGTEVLPIYSLHI